MCFYVSISKDADHIATRYSAEFEDEAGFEPIYHASGFNNPCLPVITNELPGTIQMLQWGLIPGWVKDKASADGIKTKTLNARAETIFEKPSFRPVL